MFAYGIEATDDDGRATLTNWCGVGSIANCCVFRKWSGAAAESSSAVTHPPEKGFPHVTARPNWISVGKSKHPLSNGKGCGIMGAVEVKALCWTETAVMSDTNRQVSRPKGGNVCCYNGFLTSKGAPRS